MENKQTLANQTITIENQKRILLTGIVEVVSQVDKCVLAKTKVNMVSVSGASLRVTKLSLEEGTLVVEGEIDGVKYSAFSGSKGIFKRLFK